MRKAEGYVLKRLEEEYLVLPVGERTETVNEIVTLSESAAFMYEHAEEAKDVAELAAITAEAYGVTGDTVYADVREVVAFLKQKGILL